MAFSCNKRSIGFAALRCVHRLEQEPSKSPFRLTSLHGGGAAEHMQYVGFCYCRKPCRNYARHMRHNHRLPETAHVKLHRRLCVVIRHGHGHCTNQWSVECFFFTRQSFLSISRTKIHTSIYPPIAWHDHLEMGLFMIVQDSSRFFVQHWIDENGFKTRSNSLGFHANLNLKTQSQREHSALRPRNCRALLMNHPSSLRRRICSLNDMRLPGKHPLQNDFLTP